MKMLEVSGRQISLSAPLVCDDDHYLTVRVLDDSGCAVSVLLSLQEGKVYILTVWDKVNGHWTSPER
jgi:hypothetical protein